MKRRPGLSSRPIEFMPRRFYFVITREVAPCIVDTAKVSGGSGLPVDQRRAPELPDSFPSSLRSLFPRTPGIQFISLHDQLPRASSTRPSVGSDGRASDDDGEFDVGILQTLRFNDFLTRMLTSTASSRSMPSELCNGSGASGIHQYSPRYFFVRRERLAEVVKAIHLICRWRLLYLGLSPQEALAPFEHFPFLLTTFFSPSSRFKPPSLLGSLMGIAKGVASDLLVHTDMVPWWYIGLTRPTTGDDSHLTSRANDDGTGAKMKLMLIPISRRLIVCQTSSRTATQTRNVEEFDSSHGGEVLVGDAGEAQSTVKHDDWQTQLLASHLTSANIALTIVVRSDGYASDRSDDCEPSRSSGRALLASALRSHGLAVLDLPASLDAAFNSMAESICTRDSDASHPSSTPSSVEESVVDRFLDACERTPGTIAVSSESSSGVAIDEASSNSVSTCIGCYLMKHHSFTSQEAVGWIRYCWPDEISPVRQLFLDQMQPRMWREGEQFRRRLQELQQQEAAEAAMVQADGNSEPRLGTQISIGRISLGRDSLFGTKGSDRSDEGERTGESDERTPYNRINRHHKSHLSLHQHLQSSQQSQYAGNGSPNDDFHGLVDDRGDDHGASRPTPLTSPFMTSPSLMGKQRRPMTQGSAISVRRLHRPTDGAGYARAEFSLLHKFVHQTAAPRSDSASSAGAAGARAAASPGASSASLAVGSAMAAAVARASTTESAALARRTADVSS